MAFELALLQDPQSDTNSTLLQIQQQLFYVREIYSYPGGYYFIKKMLLVLLPTGY